MADQAGIQIFGAGNALLDISSTVGPDIFEKYGIVPGNAILAEEKHMSLYEELKAMDSVQYIPGGATLNSIRVAQWMLGSEGRTAYMGILGSDEQAKTFTDGCAEEGVKTSFCIHETLPTGACAVCISDSGERSLVANLSCCNEFDAAHVDSTEAKALWESAQCGYISGFWLTVCPEGMQKIGSHILSNRGTFAINISAPFIAQFFTTQLNSVLPSVNLLFGNESEALALAGALNMETTDIATIAKKLTTHCCENPRKVIITQGKDPTVVATSEDEHVEYPVPLLSQDKIVDTNGAGDGFVGGYLSALVQGLDEETCVKHGNYAAQFIIQTSGTQFRGETASPPQ